MRKALLLGLGVSALSFAAGYGIADKSQKPIGVWKVVQASVQDPKDDPDCHPPQVIATEDDKLIIRAQIDYLRAELPAEAISLVTNLVHPQDDRIPYTGQRAIRSASILASLLQYDECVSTRQNECSPGTAEHLIRAASGSASPRWAQSINRMIGRWVILTQIDLKNSAFCWLSTPSTG